MLVDDRDERLIESIDKDSIIYVLTSDSNMDGGHVTGYAIRDTKRVMQMFQSLVKTDDPSPLVFVVGCITARRRGRIASSETNLEPKRLATSSSSPCHGGDCQSL